mgnify:CR=1 FL=1
MKKGNKMKRKIPVKKQIYCLLRHIKKAFHWQNNQDFFLKQNCPSSKTQTTKIKISDKTYRTIISTARNELGWRNTKAAEKVHSLKQKKTKTVEEKEII